jgi:hypothetical protein
MNTIEKKLVKAAGRYVTTEHVDALIRNYKTDRWMQNSERIGKEDTLGVWLSIEELEEFIQTAKMNGADGIRACFGVYGGNARSFRPGMEGRQTIAMVATSGEPEQAREIYIEKDGQTSILAYNQNFPFGNPTSPTTPPAPGTTITLGLGNVMIADKEKGLQVI